MKISVAPAIQAVRSLGPPRPVTAALAPAAAPPPSTIDLTRQLKFGPSEVDEACVVLVELSVLVYEPTATMRRALAPLKPDRWSTIRAGDARAIDGQAFGADGHSTGAPLPWRPPLFTPASSEQSAMAGGALAAAMMKRLAAGGAPDPLLPLPHLPAQLPTWPAPGLSLPTGPQGLDTKVRAAADTSAGRFPRVLAVMHGESALIVFRGTQDGLDIWRDVSCWPALAWPLRHAGFHKTWKEVQPQVNTWLEEVAGKLGKPPAVYLGGHSLGGAVATLAAMDLAKSYPVARVVTLGAPRPGGWLLRKRYANTPLTPAADGACTPLPGRLPDVTTRWVHGLDVFATFLPPPLVTAHVAKAEPLRTSDRLDMESYFAASPFDSTPLINLVSRLNDQRPAPGGRAKDLRRLAGQIGLSLSMWLPASWWTRVLVYLAPMVAEQAARSGFQHQSRRYLGFMPPTALARAMHDASNPPGGSNASPVRH